MPFRTAKARLNIAAFALAVIVIAGLVAYQWSQSNRIANTLSMQVVHTRTQLSEAARFLNASQQQHNPEESLRQAWMFMNSAIYTFSEMEELDRTHSEDWSWINIGLMTGRSSVQHLWAVAQDNGSLTVEQQEYLEEVEHLVLTIADAMQGEATADTGFRVNLDSEAIASAANTVRGFQPYESPTSSPTPPPSEPAEAQTVP